MFTGCSEGCNINYQHQLNGIKTHMAEMRNAAVKRLKAMLSHMNQDSFMSHLKLDLWFRNAILYLKKPSLHRHTKKNNEEKRILYSHVISYGYRQMQLFRALAGAWEFCIIYWWVSATYCSCWWGVAHIVITRYSYTLICVAQGSSVPICVCRTELCLI